MPSGIRTFNSSGQVQFDIDTITSRVIGSLVSSTSTPVTGSSISVPVTSGKDLWVYYYVVGPPSCKVVRNSPSINSFTYYMDTSAGSGDMYIFYGEC